MTAQIIPFPTPARDWRRHHETLGDVVVVAMARHHARYALVTIARAEGSPARIEVICSASLLRLTRRAAELGIELPQPGAGHKVFVASSGGRRAWYTLEALALLGRLGGAR
jgi:hypothetical protein